MKSLTQEQRLKSRQPNELGLAEGTLRAERGRFVVLGGPGQGKTTVGQFIAQLYRLSLLQPRPAHTLSPDVRPVIEEIAEQCRREKIPLPVARRFPLRIVLSKFAAAPLQRDEERSVLSYLASYISARAVRAVTIGEFRRWLAAYPWLLILDGLDEVQASSNRDEVLRAVQDFLVDVANDNADILIVATSRPQGYNDGFSPNIYAHWWLAPLLVDEALHYAKRLVEERYRNDEDRQQKVVERLQRAAGHESTRRLMQTPLQVTILAALLDTIGQAPRDRWRLFHEYYGVILRREMEKPTVARTVLRDYRTDVDAIHESVALLLQGVSEGTGGTDAYLSHQEVAAVVRSRLQSEGHEGDELDRLTAEIWGAASERLGFLVGSEEGKIGFEIRSLQEFMAAEALAKGADVVLSKRLKWLAPLENWRNVTLFFAGRCFAEREYMSDAIIAACAELNDMENDASLGAIRAGSRLAADLLEDGAARSKPKAARVLAREALYLLGLPAEKGHESLAEVYDDSLAGSYEDALGAGLGTQGALRTSFWVVLLGLVRREIGWAIDLANQRWPSEIALLDEVVRIGGRSFRDEAPSEWWLQKLLTALPRLSPTVLMLYRRTFRQPQEHALPAWFSEALAEPRAGLGPTPLSFTMHLLPPKQRSSTRAVTRLRMESVESDGQTSAVLEMPDPSSDWKFVQSAIRFAGNPSASGLAIALEEIAAQTIQWPKMAWLFHMPWPLEAALGFNPSPDRLMMLAQRARDGELGDIEDWLQAEERWREQGVSEQDLLLEVDADLPFERRISSVGFPHGAGRLSPVGQEERDEQARAVTGLIQVFGKMRSGRHKELMLDLIRSMLMYLEEEGSEIRGLADDFVFSLVTAGGHNEIEVEFIIYAKDVEEFVICYNRQLRSAFNGKQMTTNPFISRRISEKLQSRLCGLFMEKRDLIWLVRPIAALTASGISPTVSGIWARLDLDNLTSGERAGAMILKIADGEWSESDVAHLAKAEMREEIDRLVPTFRQMIQFGTSGNLASIEALLVALWGELDVNESSLRRKLVDGLSDVVSRRRSGLLKQDVWEYLGLPSGLREAVGPGAGGEKPA